MKRVVVNVIALCIVVFCLFALVGGIGNSEPEIPLKNVEYTGSDTYMAGKFYSQLIDVKLTGNPRKDIVNVAKSQLGYQEGSELGEYSGLYMGSNNCTEFGWWYTEYKQLEDSYANAQWCAMFVSWCAFNAGISEDIIKYHSYTETQWSLFTGQDRSYTWEEVQIGEYKPQAGDVVYFLSSTNAASTSNPRRVNHVGIVTGFKDGVLYTIEGNASSTVFTTDGGCVTTREYAPDSTYVAYVCSPDYENVKTESDGPIKVDGDYIPENVQSVVFDEEYYAKKYPDVAKDKGTSKAALYKHFVKEGVDKGYQGSALFSVKYFVENNPSVNSQFGGSKPDYRGAIKFFGETAAFNDTATYLTAPSEDLGSTFSSKIMLSNAKLNFSLSDTTVIAYTPSTAPAQIYDFVKQSDGSYVAYNTKNNLVMQLESDTKSGGVGVQIGEESGLMSQKWFIYKNHDNTYVLQSAVAPACAVTVSSDSPSAMDEIIIDKYSGKPSQCFVLFEPISSTVQEDNRLDISALPTCGIFTDAGYDQWTYFLNMGNGGTNNSMKHSIGAIDLSKLSKISVRYGNDSSVRYMGTLQLLTASGEVIDSKELKPAKGWKATNCVEFDVSKYSNNEELMLKYVDSVSGIVVTRITLE